MEIVKLATDWAKAEVFSTRFFILFGLFFLIASIGFWQLGKTTIAKAYGIPTLIAGILLMIIGLGLLYTNKSRIVEFEKAANENPSAFVQVEFDRIDKTINEYNTIVFKIIPFIIAVAALSIVFVDKPLWRASAITTIAMMVIILLVDGTAYGRIKLYKQQLEMVSEK